MKPRCAAILCLLLFVGAPAIAAGSGIEDLPERERPAPADLLPAAEGPSVDLFRYRPDPEGGPTIRRDPPLRFLPPAPFDGEHPGWFLDSVGIVATNALADFRLRPAGEPELEPDEPEPPRTEVVPEPATLLLFLAGALLIFLLSVRRRAPAR